MKIPKPKRFKLKGVSGFPIHIDHQHDTVMAVHPRFMFADALEHFDKHIYGIPLDDHFVLDIEPLDDKPRITLHKLYFPERDYVMAGKSSPPPGLGSSSNSFAREGNVAIGDVKSFSNSLGSEAIYYLRDIAGGEGAFEKDIIFKDYVASGNKKPKPDRSWCKDKSEYEEKLRDAISSRLSTFVPALEGTSQSALQWSRGVSLESSRSVYMLSFYHHRHVAFKKLGTELMFFFVGFNPKRPEWQEKVVQNFGQGGLEIANNPTTFLYTNREFLHNTDFSECVEDTFWELDFFKKCTYDRLWGHAAHLDYIYCRKDERIYGLSWFSKTQRQVFPHSGVGSGDGGTIKGGQGNQLKIAPFKNEDNSYYSTRLTPTPLRYSMTSYGTLETGNKFSLSIEHDGCLYGIPNRSSSILKVNPDEIYEGSPKVSRFGDLDDVVVGQQTRKFEGAVKTPTGLFLIPYNASRFLRITGQDCIQTTLEEFVGPRKFRSGVYCEALDSVLLAPFDYPELLSISNSNETRSLYHFDTPFKYQGAKYSDLVKYNDNNYFCIPFARRAVLHINIDGQVITCREYPIDPDQLTPFFLKGVFSGGAIYCIPFYGNSVLKIFMKGKDVMLENYLLPQDNSGGGKKFSDAVLLDDGGVIIGVPFDFNKILVIKPGDPPAFKYIIPFTTVKDGRVEETVGLFDQQTGSTEANAGDAKNKFRTACDLITKVVFVPYSYNKFLFIDKKHFIFDENDSGFSRQELDDEDSTQNEFYNYPSSRLEMFCGAHVKDKSLFLMPNTETSVLRLRFEE